MVAPRASSDEEGESDAIRHSLPRDTAAQEVISEYTFLFINAKHELHTL